jgi:hypothetical protein
LGLVEQKIRREKGGAINHTRWRKQIDGNFFTNWHARACKHILCMSLEKNVTKNTTSMDKYWNNWDNIYKQMSLEFDKSLDEWP